MKRLCIVIGFVGGMILASRAAVTPAEEAESQKRPVSFPLRGWLRKKDKEEDSSTEGDQQEKRRKIVRINSNPLPDPVLAAEKGVKADIAFPLKSILRNRVVEVLTEYEESTEEEDVPTDTEEDSQLPRLTRCSANVHPPFSS